MFKLLIVFSSVAICAATYNHAQLHSAGGLVHHGHGSPQNHLGHAATLKYNSDAGADGHYNFGYETSNGISAHETGVGSHQASGGYAYVSPEGQHIQVSYTADKHGFHATGAHLPTPPPIPHEILKSLEYNRAHPYVESATGHAPSSHGFNSNQHYQQSHHSYDHY